MKKILINTFALIGFVTFILLACSVDEIADSSNNNNNQFHLPQSKYQVSNVRSYNIVVLNTETGAMKSYGLVIDNGVGSWEEQFVPITFTH